MATKKKRILANWPLEAKIIGEQLVISIGISTLAYAIQNGTDDWVGKITSEAGFAQDVIDELLNEEEDGTTLVHKMFDEAAREAADQGSEYVSSGDEDFED